MVRIRRCLAGIAAALLLAGAAACGDDDDVVSSDGGDGGGPGAAIEGDYVATEVIEDGAPKQLVDGTTIRLRLADGSLTASAGCNTIGGTYTIEDDRLQVGATSMTEMGCDEPRHAQDTWLADVLSSGPALEPADDGFVLRTDATTITFVERSVVDPDRPLVATTWVVDGYLEGTGPDGAVSSAAAGDDEAQVRFEANGFVTGHDGCNGFGYGGEAGGVPTDGLRYEVDGDQISFTGAAVTTDIACPDLDTDRFWAALSGRATWEVDGPRLTLVGEDDRGVTYRAEDEPAP